MQVVVVTVLRYARGGGVKYHKLMLAVVTTTLTVALALAVAVAIVSE